MAETTRAKLREARARSEKIITPAIRRWAYGVAAAALGLAAVLGYIPPETAIAAAPLLMAIFYVDKTGEPR